MSYVIQINNCYPSTKRISREMASKADNYCGNFKIVAQTGFTSTAV